MFKDTQAFSGFSVNDLEATKEFYSTVLGVDVQSDQMGLHLNIPGGIPIFVYPKKDHTPASFTILNFPVENIDEAVEALTAKGVAFEHYEMTDEKGIARGLSRNMGPDIAWFKDPSGNILSVLQQNP
ncbi:MAG TPA: VOC family protein [Verrucomicrobiae bacterium]|jgi:predicted enzyme related to lactoylglutathione lyase|nr:VOC family protein [Verrucomicrobiae bacterium]